MKWLLVTVLLLAARCTAQTITISWDSTAQTIDGFGAASAGNVPTLPSSLMDFFYTDSGINLTFIRVKIYPDLTDCNTDEGSGNCVSVSSGTTAATLSVWDLANAQAAVARGALVWAAEWSPPGSMKSNGNFETGGSFLGGATNMANLAEIQASFVTLLTGTYGIPIYAISPQNEPDQSTNYPSCTWTPQQIHDYIPYLTTALANAGYSTRIMVAEESDWGNSYSTTAMDDPTVAADLSILASHAYSGSAQHLSWNNFTTQRVWQTEVSDSSTYDGSITSGLTYATELHNWLTTAMVNSWHYWLLSASAGYTDNEALTDSSNNLAKRAYTFGNFSKFVRPGWTRVEVTNSTGLLVSAYQGTTGSAIVVVNNGSAVNDQVFSVGTTMGTAVVPWITSSSQSLAQQPLVSVSSGSFPHTIPASSVVTFQALPSNSHPLDAERHGSGKLPRRNYHRPALLVIPAPRE